MRKLPSRKRELYEVVEIGPYGEGRRHLVHCRAEAEEIARDLIKNMGIMVVEIVRLPISEHTKECQEQDGLNFCVCPTEEVTDDDESDNVGC